MIHSCVFQSSVHVHPANVPQGARIQGGPTRFQINFCFAFSQIFSTEIVIIIIVKWQQSRRFGMKYGGMSRRAIARQLAEGRKCFILRRSQHILFTVIWRKTYGKEPLRYGEGNPATATWATLSD